LWVQLYHNGMKVNSLFELAARQFSALAGGLVVDRRIRQAFSALGG